MAKKSIDKMTENEIVTYIGEGFKKILGELVQKVDEETNDFIDHDWQEFEGCKSNIHDFVFDYIYGCIEKEFDNKRGKLLYELDR